jgi:sec-independent protein translocase protein TatB
MFGMSPWHIAVLVVVALVVFGPDKLPGMIKDLGKALRQVRATALTMQDDLKSELGPEVGDLDLRSLHPRTFVEKHLFGDDDIDTLKKIAEPLTSLGHDEPVVSPSNEEPYQPFEPYQDPEPEIDPVPVQLEKSVKHRYDVDAT